MVYRGLDELGICAGSLAIPEGLYSEAIARAIGAPGEITLAMAAADAVQQLAAKGAKGAEKHYFQSILFFLHESNHTASRQLRSWLASLCYDAMEEAIPFTELKPKSHADFEQLLASHPSMSRRLGNPMSAYLFNEDSQSDIGALRIYIWHHWHRSRSFWRLLVDFAERLALDHAATLYTNVSDETGANGTPPHPHMLRELVRYLELPCYDNDPPSDIESLEYLNNRTRCARTSHPAWGLAVLWSLEAVTTETHKNIHTLLVKHDVPTHARAFHHLHMTHDQEHADELQELLPTLASDEEARTIFLTSLEHQRRLSRQLFGKIWEQIQRCVMQ